MNAASIVDPILGGLEAVGTGLAAASDPVARAAGAVLVVLAKIGRGVMGAVGGDPAEARARLERLAELDRRITRAQLSEDDAELDRAIRELYASGPG